MGTITLRREPRWNSKAWAMKVTINGRQVGKLADGATATYEVDPGRHAVQVAMTWLSSPPVEVEVAAGADVQLVCSVPMMSMKSLNLELVGGPAAASLPRAAAPEPEIGAAGPAVGDLAAVQLASETERVEAASEHVRVPAGVEVTVKRSRTFEHTVEIGTSREAGGELKAGISALSGSIRAAISQQRQQSFQATETIEYEVALDGNEHSVYKLAWVDVWRTGTAELTRGAGTTILPFRFREATELDVVPVEAT